MYFRSLLYLVAVSATFFLQADDQIKTEIEQDIKHHNYDHLGKLLKQNLGEKITFSELKFLAKENHCKPLLKAIDATKKIKTEITNLPLNRSELLQTALFIETVLPKYAKKHTYYLPKEKTGLKHSVEFDPKNNTRFIVLDGKEAYIGAGAKKVVHKAIYYNHKRPQVVARAVDCTKQTRELTLTKELHNAPGIFKTVGFGTYKEHGKTYSTIYSKFYEPGSLQDAFDKHYDLSRYEKMKVATQILEGLHSLHKRGIIHCDLGARNYLIDIPKGSPGKRNVSACIADLGRANIAKHTAKIKVQGNTTYTAPEGLYTNKLKGSDYYKTDVFAVGCVFYRLFYDKKAPWQDMSYVKDMTHPVSGRYKVMKYRIEGETKERRIALQKKHKRSAYEDFELLVLKMLHTDPHKRGTAKELAADMKKIFKKAH
jgi:serine/threonine protein kinase